MNSSFEYLDIILIAIIAGFIILRLRGILGRRTGHEKKNVINLFDESPKQKFTEEKADNLSLNKFDNAAKEQFIKGAKTAYEMIITSFAKGDKKALKSLLDKKYIKTFLMKLIKEKKKI